jgi:transposase InsO family protein
VKYHFIEAEKGNYPVSVMCRVLEASEKGFYYWHGRREEPDRRLGENETELRAAIVELHQRSRGAYGRPRLLADLRRHGFRVGGNRVRRIMLEMGLEGRSGPRRSRRMKPTKAAPSPNLLARNFAPSRPNSLWAGDITEIEAGGRKLWMAVVIDLYSRRVVGSSLGDSASAGLVVRAMKEAVKERRPPRGLIFHSDQGVQYASERFRRQLRLLGVQQSMSRRGNCWDNAPIESYFATLKKELIYTREWSSKRELEDALVIYVSFYNHQRLHSTLNYNSPDGHEKHHEETTTRFAA